tara:strand:+ start:4480 stop:5055 length:576 start_codon:yes stop_codon:yes gene_type:complete
MQGRKSGYFLVYRDVWKHKVFRNLIESSVWLYMISSASHQDKTLNFLNSRIFVKRGELIFPVRKNGTFWKMTYSEMRTFILRLKRRGMITTRLAQLTPTSNHPRRNITIISVINYDKFQYVDNDRPASAQLSPLTNTQDTNKQYTKYSIKNKSSKDIVYTGNQFGDYSEIKLNGEFKWKHKFLDKPLKDKL